MPSHPESSGLEGPKAELGLFLRTVRETARGRAKDTAATIAFWAFFSIFPLLMGVLSLAGYYVESAELMSRIHDVVSDLLPGSAGLVNENLDAVVRRRGTMSLIATAGLFWSASKGFGAVTRGINRAIGTESQRSFLRSSARQFFMALAVSVLLILSIAVTVAVEILFDASLLSRLGLEAIDVPRLEGWATSFLMVFSLFALIYKLAPSVDVAWKQVLPGALLGAVVFELGKAVFVFYLERIAHLEAVYGSLSSIIVLLLWLYLSAMVLLIGAEYNIVRWRARSTATE